MIYLRQSTASQEVLLGPFVDATDGVTAETGLTIANTDIKIWKTGATTLANKNSGGATHISAGNYYAVFDATDSDTIGPLRVVVQVSGALAFFMDLVVLDEAVYDALFGTTALATATNITAAAGIAVSSIGNDVITAASIQAGAIGAAEIADGAIDAATFAAGAITASAIAADAIGASELAADAATEIATAVWASADRQLTALDEDATTIDLNATTIGTVTTLTNLPAITANWLTAAGLAADAATEIAAAVLAAVVTGTTTVAQSLILLQAFGAGKASGLGTATAVYRDIADTTDVITATVDASGNRTVVVIVYP